MTGLSGSHIGGQFQIYVLECRPSHAQLLQALPTRKRLTRQLAEQPRRIVSLTLHELSREGQALWAFLRDWTRQTNPSRPEEVEFTRRELRNASGMQDHRLRAALVELVQMEYAAKLEGQNGVTYRYRLLLTEASAQAPLGLTTPEELEARWKP